MIEFALSLPFLLLIVVGILYFGRYFLLSQVLLYAAQEASRVASRTPNLSNDTVRDSVRGFTVTGAQTNPNSSIYAALAAADLLSQGNTGDMPVGSRVEILPWDSDGTAADTIPAGTVAVRIDYPFQLLGRNFNGPKQGIAIAMSGDAPGAPVRFLNFTITQRAVASQEIYQN